MFKAFYFCSLESECSLLRYLCDVKFVEVYVVFDLLDKSFWLEADYSDVWILGFTNTLKQIFRKMPKAMLSQSLKGETFKMILTEARTKYRTQTPQLYNTVFDVYFALNLVFE